MQSKTFRYRGHFLNIEDIGQPIEHISKDISTKNSPKKRISFPNKTFSSQQNQIMKTNIEIQK